MDAMNGAKTYLFKVVIEDDSHEDERQAHHAYCPALEQYGGSTWGNTREETLQHIQEVVQMIVHELIEEGALLPDGPFQDVEVFSEPRVAVTA